MALSTAIIATVLVWLRAVGPAIAPPPFDGLRIRMSDDAPGGLCINAGSPHTLVAGSRAWDLSSASPLCIPLNGAPAKPDSAVLSADGSTYAACNWDDGAQAWRIGVWSAAAGQHLATRDIRGRARQPSLVAFCDTNDKQANRWLLVVASDPPRLSSDPPTVRVHLWDWAAHDAERAFPLTGAGRTTLSPNGHCLAAVAPGGLQLYDVPAGHRSQLLRFPTTVDPTGIDSRVAGVAFSPNGRELAVLMHGVIGRDPNQLLIWDTRAGRLLCDGTGSSMPADLPSDVDESRRLARAVQWSPDGAYLLLGGTWLVDRASGGIVWHLADPSPNDRERWPAFLDADHLLARRGADLVPVALPTADLLASLAALKNPRTLAYLRPGGAVRLGVRCVPPLRGDPEQTTRDLVDGMGRALALSGVAVAPGQPVEVDVTFTEDTWGTLEGYTVTTIRHGETPAEHWVAQRARCSVRVEMRMAGVAKPIWSEQIQCHSPRDYAGPANDGIFRELMMTDLSAALSRLVVPNFVPADPTLKPLPIFTP